jgi:hypothetical protein
MQKYLRCIAAFAFVGSLAAPAVAGELKLTMANGRVTLIADQVPVRQILAEWARIGETKIVNGEKIVGAPLTLQLIDMPEGQALDIILRSAAGYMAAPRTAAHPGPSVYDRIMILATSRPPAFTPQPTPTFRPPMPQPMQEPVEEQEEPEVVPAPGQEPPPNVQSQPGIPMQPEQPTEGQPQQPQPQQPVVSPRPGPIPMTPVPGQPYNPYRPPPRRPGGGGGEGL